MQGQFVQHPDFIYKSFSVQFIGTLIYSFILSDLKSNKSSNENQITFYIIVADCCCSGF